MFSKRYRISIYRAFKAILLLAVVTCTQSYAQTATTTALSILAAGSPVSTVSTGTAITLTAKVTAAGSAIQQGQVNFCNATAAHCTDIHILGTVALNAGTATLSLRPSPGTYSYKAEFVGTPGAATPYAASASTSAALTVTGTYQSAAIITPTGSPGSYTLTSSIYGFNKTPSAPAPAGTVSFLDTTTSNSKLSTASLSASAPGPYSINSADFPVGNEPNSIVSGDFNGDGNQDFAIGLNSNTNTVAVLLGDGHGNFQPVTSSPITATGNPVLVADFNGDGKPDILLTYDLGPSALTVLLGNGDGTFTPAPDSPIYTNYGGAPIVSADFNGDGIPDLAVAGGYYLVVLLGKGDGTFTQLPTSSSIPEDAQFSSMVTGDFNKDGKQDLAVIDDSGISIYLGNGDGTFNKGATISSPSGGTIANLTTADFNGDGKLDLAASVSGNPDDSLAIYLGNGDGTFTPAGGSPIPTISAVDVTNVGDFNGDGIPDIYAYGMTSAQDFTILLGKGDGTFNTVPSANLPQLPCCSNATLADFNNDGITDVIASDFYYSQGDVYLTAPTLSTATVSGIAVTGSTSPQLVLTSYPGDSTYSPSQSATTPLEVQVAAPIFTPAQGTIGQTQSITITTATPGATIYYQTSGAYSNLDWIPYSGPLQIPVLGATTIQAYATAFNYGQSPTTTANYTVVPVEPGFTLSAAPTSGSVAQNASVTSTITVTDVGGFTGTVVLAASGLPSGVTSSFAAGTAAGTQVLTLTAASTAAIGGPVTVTVTGTSGALSAVTTISLTVTAEPAFGPSRASGSDAAITVEPGATTGNTSTISVAGVNGYSGTVKLSCTVSPTAANDPATCSLSPASVILSGGTAQTSTLTVTTVAASSAQNEMKKLLWPSAGGAGFALALLIRVPRKRRNWLAALGLALLFASIGVIGCSGGGNSGGGHVGSSGTSAGTYTVIVTGTGTSSGSSSPVTATVGTVALTVN